MEIVDSFIKQNGIYEFTELCADASNKKKFYKTNDIVLVQIEDIPNNFEEYFNTNNSLLSQYDYFVHGFNILNNPILHYYDNKGIVLMPYLGNITLKDYLLTNSNDNLYFRMIDLLMEFQNIKLQDDDIINLRTYSGNAMMKESQFYINSLKSLTNYDKGKLRNELKLLIDGFNDMEMCICHRDFQSKNIMYHNDQMHLIDIQDICIGPYLHDLACMLYESSVPIIEEKRQLYAKYYYDKKRIRDPFDSFYKKLQIMGFIRILKSIGIHTNYFVNNDRWASYNLIYNNNLLLNNLHFPQITQITDKYKSVAIVLAAGRGKRMNSKTHKTLCEINGKPMLLIILDKLSKLLLDKIIIIIGYQKEDIMNALKKYPFKNIEFVEQKELLGTGHAVLQSYDILKDYKHNCIVHFGDNPNIKENTLANIMNSHIENDNDITIGTYEDEISYTKGGRVIRSNGKIIMVHEDANENYPSIEFFSGVQVYKIPILFKNLKEITNNNIQKEYYLPDIIKITIDHNEKVGNYTINKNELINVNTKTELLLAIRCS